MEYLKFNIDKKALILAVIVLLLPFVVLNFWNLVRLPAVSSFFSGLWAKNETDINELSSDIKDSTDDTGQTTNGQVTASSSGSGIKKPASSPSLDFGTAPIVPLTPLPQTVGKPDDMKEYVENLQEAGQESNIVEIKAGCEISPHTTRLKYGADFIIRNSDTERHTIAVISPLYLPSRGEVRLRAEFLGAGFYALICDGETKGFLDISK